MIDRYTNPEMAALFTDDARYRIWLDIERYALEGMVAAGQAPAEALKAFNDKAAFEVERVLAIEAEVKHDVIASLPVRSSRNDLERCG